MAKPRSELSAILHSFCKNVYFQPPADKKLTYPCIIYSLDTLDVGRADNGVYRLNDEYSITYVTRDPDDENIRKLARLPMCTMTNASSQNNLHNNHYRLYF